MNSKQIWTSSLAIVLFFSLFLTSCLRNPSEDLPDLYETLQEDGRFSLFAEALDRVGVIEDITTYYFTLLAPPDNIFQSYLESKGYGSLDSIPEKELANVIRYHIQQGKTDVGILFTNYYLTPSLSGPDSTNAVIFLEVITEGLRINGNVNVIQTDIEARNGFIHVIDQVLEPLSMWDLLSVSDNFAIFQEGAERAGLKELLESGAPYTAFVPTNEVFENYFDQVEGVAELEDIEDEVLKPFMRYHICPGNIRNEDFSNSYLPEKFATLSAGDSLSIGGEFSLTINDTVSFILSNIQGTNGNLHFITDVLDPKE
jgi:uncharacterized surface protein with fasciclin (FAS1) repeats